MERKLLKPMLDQHTEGMSQYTEGMSSQPKIDHQDLKGLKFSIGQSDSWSYCSRMVD
jgi:hypothetical protein